MEKLIRSISKKGARAEHNHIRPLMAFHMPMILYSPNLKRSLIRDSCCLSGLLPEAKSEAAIFYSFTVDLDSSTANIHTFRRTGPKPIWETCVRSGISTRV
jgi:hypothetical protein